MITRTTRGQSLTEKIHHKTIKGSIMACLLSENNYFLRRLTTSLKSWKQPREVKPRLTGTGRLDWDHKFQRGHQWETIPSQVKTWSPCKGTWTVSMTTMMMKWPCQLLPTPNHIRDQQGKHISQHLTSASIHLIAPEKLPQRHAGPSVEARTCLPT